LLDLIGGDFNCTPLSAEYRALTAWLGADVQRLDGRPHEPTFRGAREPATMGRTLDYVYCSPRAGASADRARTEVVFASDRPEDRLSDHLGIRASIGVTRRPVAVVSATPGSPAAWPVVTSLRRLLAPFHD
jgi:endonuclease/exonuclease/phosphatase family metal-dependent hydrolase